MGGLVALLFAARHPRSLSALVSVEGNLAPEDCTISRTSSDASPQRFENGRYLVELAAMLRASGKTGFAQYAAALSSLVSPRAFRDYCVSIVHLSDETPLLDTFARLALPKLFIHGAANGTLSYLPWLRASGIPVVAIQGSDHFPANSAPDDFVAALEDFLCVTQDAADH